MPNIIERSKRLEQIRAYSILDDTIKRANVNPFAPFRRYVEALGYHLIEVENAEIQIKKYRERNLLSEKEFEESTQKIKLCIATIKVKMEECTKGKFNYKINDYLKIFLVDGETLIFVKDRIFTNCKMLIFNLLEEDIVLLENLNSIDEISDIYVNQIAKDRALLETNLISPEAEFWGHCSNLQAWAEHNYDTNILNYKLAFPLLKELSRAGDSVAKKAFKDEIIKRFSSKYLNVISYLILEDYMSFFSLDELEILIREHLDWCNTLSSREKSQFSRIWEDYAFELEDDNPLKRKAYETSILIDPLNVNSIFNLGLLGKILIDAIIHQDWANAFKITLEVGKERGKQLTKRDHNLSLTQKLSKKRIIHFDKQMLSQILDLLKRTESTKSSELYCKLMGKLLRSFGKTELSFQFYSLLIRQKKNDFYLKLNLLYNLIKLNFNELKPGKRKYRSLPLRLSAKKGVLNALIPLKREMDYAVLNLQYESIKNFRNAFSFFITNENDYLNLATPIITEIESNIKSKNFNNMLNLINKGYANFLNKEDFNKLKELTIKM